MCTKDAALPATKQFIAMAETQYQARVQEWRSDAGGEYTSNVFVAMLKDRGICVTQSVPYAHQQNGRAEWIIRMLMERAESMRLQACLPQSYWEFALDHATHVYNRTPICQLKWHSPYEWMRNERPSVDHLRVFGSGAYIFIPHEIWKDKMSPKSELMTYIGQAPGGLGWLFMHSPNNVIFTAAQATFDESIFPKCPKTKSPEGTRLQSNVPVPTCTDQDHCVGGKDCHCPIVEDNEGAPLPLHKKGTTNKGKAKEMKQQARDRELEHYICNIPLPSSRIKPPFLLLL